jgi:hypothetical protein
LGKAREDGTVNATTHIEPFNVFDPDEEIRGKVTVALGSEAYTPEEAPS